MSAIIFAQPSNASNENGLAPIAERPLSPEAFAEVKAAWKDAARRKALSSSSIALWAIIRGADPAKGFSPVTNPTKLANGQAPWAARDSALLACGRLSGDALAPWAELLLKSGAVPGRFSWSPWTGSHPLLSLAAQPRSAC